VCIVAVFNWSIIVYFIKINKINNNEFNPSNNTLFTREGGSTRLVYS